MWGKYADIELQKNDIVSFKRLRITSFQGKQNLNTTFDSLISINSKMPEIEDFERWTKSQKKNDFIENHKRRSFVPEEKIYNLEEIKNISSALIDSKQKQSFTCCFYLLRFENEGRNSYYISCINERCFKKVILGDDGYYFCESCEEKFEKVINSNFL